MAQTRSAAVAPAPRGSGKILRRAMKRIVDHDPWSTPATIEDPKALHEIREALEARAPFWIEA